MAKLSEYKGLNLGKEEAKKATEEEITAEIQRLQNNPKSFVNKEGEANLGDTVNIDYEGFVDEVAFEGGKGENYDLTLGSGTFIPGFEEQLVGHKASEDVEVNVIFPENYHAENLKGKKALFKCKIHAVKTKPALDDKFANSLGVPSFNALREEITLNINSRHEDENFNKFVEKVATNIIEKSGFEVNEDDLKNKYDEMIKYYDAELARQGLSLEQYLQMTGSSMDKFKEQMKPQAEQSVKMDKLFEEVAEKENLQATQEDIDARLKSYTAYYSIPEDKVKEFFVGERLEELKKDLLQNKVAKFLFDNNN
jgi:trigger factor